MVSCDELAREMIDREHTISINELTGEMIDRGYKITPRTIRHYIEKGLLPKVRKQGGYKEGVRLVFEDKEKALDTLVKIYSLKGKGYKLSDIKKEMNEERIKKLKNKTKSHFDLFIEQVGHFFVDHGDLESQHGYPGYTSFIHSFYFSLPA